MCLLHLSNYREAVLQNLFKLWGSGLSEATTWQQLKDYMIPAGKVIYATVERQSEGEGTCFRFNNFVHHDLVPTILATLV